MRINDRGASRVAYHSNSLPASAGLVLVTLLLLLGSGALGQTPVSDGFDYPVGAPDSYGYYNAQDFGEWNATYSGYHLGEDWNGVGGGNTDLGDPVYAISHGSIVFAEWVNGWGNVMILHHILPDGTTVRSMYAHLDAMLVLSGNAVRGQQIGTIGTGGGLFWAHLHFEIRTDTSIGVGSGYAAPIPSGWIDPSDFIDAHRTLAVSTQTSWQFNTTGNAEGWTAVNANYDVAWGQLIIDPSAPDPWIENVTNVGFDAADFNLVYIQMASNANDDEGALYYHHAGAAFSASYLETFQVANRPDTAGNAPAFDYIIDMGSQWSGHITGLRIDPCSGGSAPDHNDAVGFEFIELENGTRIAPSVDLQILPDQDVFRPGDTQTKQVVVTGGTNYTVFSYVRCISPTGVETWAYYDPAYLGADGRPNDPNSPLSFSGSRRPLYNGTWLASSNTWEWDIYTFGEGAEEGTWTWVYEYWDVTGERLTYDTETYEVGSTASDTTPPPAPINLSASPSGWTNTNSFLINWTNPSDPSGIAAVWYKRGSVPTHSADGTRTTSHPFTTAANDEGGETLYVWLEDGVGNKSHVNRSTTPLYYDGTQPTCGLSINDNVSTTNSLIVTLSPNAIDVGGSGRYQMRFSNNNSDWSSWESYNTTRSNWDLSGNGGNSNEGTKTAYCEVSDYAGNVVSPSCSDTINYTPSDTTPPPAPINLTASPSGWTNTNSFLINWTNPSDPSGIAAVWYKKGSVPTHSADGTRTTSHPFTTTANAEGGETLYVWLEDGVGNKSHVNRSTTPLYYDGTRPTCGLSINDNISTTNSLIVTLSPNAIDLGGSGRYQMRFSNNNSDWSSWESYSTTRSNWDLSGNGGNSNEGTKTAYCEVSDYAGNVVSPSCSDTINYTASDTTAPTPDPMTWSSVPSVAGATTISMTATTATDPSGVEYSFEETSGSPGGDSSGWQDSATYTDTGIQVSTEYCYQVKARDKSANQNETGWSNASCATSAPSPTSAVFRVDDAGNVLADEAFYGESFQTGAADIAEWVHITTPVEPGAILELDPDKPGMYRQSEGRCSTLVGGVVSTKPGVTLGYEIEIVYEGKALLALVGIVPVKVTDEGGPIQPGDLLVTSSTPGHAMRLAGPDPCLCSLVGKALEPMDEEKGVILVLLTAH